VGSKHRKSCPFGNDIGLESCLEKETKLLETLSLTTAI